MKEHVEWPTVLANLEIYYLREFRKLVGHKKKDNVFGKFVYEKCERYNARREYLDAVEHICISFGGLPPSPLPPKPTADKKKAGCRL